MFQKMSDEEIERRARLRPDIDDAEEYRQSIVTGGGAESEQEESFHQTTDKEFKRRYGGPFYLKDKHNSSQNNVQNVRMTYSEGGRSKRPKKAVLQYYEEESFSDETRPTNKSRLRLTKDYKNDTQIEKTSYLTGKMYGVAGKGLLSTAYAWTNFIWGTTQLWAGIILAVVLGITMYLDELISSGKSQIVIDAYLRSQGVDWDFHLILFVLFVVVVTLGYVQLIGVAIQAKALKLHPLGGPGSSFKTGAFLLCFVGYWIPIVNCLPLVNLYIFSIQIAPR